MPLVCWVLSQPTLLRASEARLTGVSSMGGKCAESPPTFIERKTLEKTKGNQSWRIFQIQELSLRLRKVLAPLTFVPKDNSLKLESCEIVYLNFISFLFLRSTKAGLLLLRTLHRRGNQTYVVLPYAWIKWFFYLKGDHFKALDLKNDPFYLVRNWNDKLSKPYFCGRAWLGKLILALVSL